jgi:hypothetical protein
MNGLHLLHAALMLSPQEVDPGDVGECHLVVFGPASTALSITPLTSTWLVGCRGSPKGIEKETASPASSAARGSTRSFLELFGCLNHGRPNAADLEKDERFVRNLHGVFPSGSPVPSGYSTT